MLGEIWTYKMNGSSGTLEELRPVLIIGIDEDYELQFVEIDYVVGSLSEVCGIYDVEIDEETAHSIGLKRQSVIKTTKIFTANKSKLGSKIGVLPDDIKEEFKEKYKEYQDLNLNKW